MKKNKIVVLLFVMSVLLSSFLNAEDLTKLAIKPEKILLTPALMRQPIRILGSGYGSEEMVFVDLVVPDGVHVKGLGPGENRVGIAVATVDKQGAFQTKIEVMSLLQTFFQVNWDPVTQKPDFKTAKPLSPGKYYILAVGIDSNKTSDTVLEILPFPKTR